MTFPQGPYWQDLRQRALGAIPLGSALDYRAPLTLRQWQTRGAYTVTAVTGKRFELAAFTTEIGGAMLAESEYYLDHAAEHQVVVMNQIRANTWTSPAWQLVTIYYWAYYAALAITRLIGDSIWFVDDHIAKQLSTLAPTGSARLGAGAFRITCDAALSATERQVHLTKISARAHDAIWKLWSEIVDGIASKNTSIAGSLEERFFGAMRRATTVLGSAWPSDLRNLVNYRPGFAYQSVRNPKVPSAARYVRFTPPYTFDALLASFESGVASLTPKLLVAAQPEAVGTLLIDYTLLLHTLSRALHDDIIDRSGLDKRWRRSRAGFLERHEAATKSAIWPCG